MAIFDVKIWNCDVGISVSHGGLKRISGRADISDCGVAVQERDPNIGELIGLPLDAPPEQLIEILTILKSHHKADEAQKIAHIKRSRLWDTIQGASNLTGIVANLIAISIHPDIAPLIESLKATLRK